MLVFLASRKTKESGGESKDEEDGNDSDASSSSQNQQNGDTRSNKQRTSRQAAKTKGNGEKCPSVFFFFFDFHLLFAWNCDESTSNQLEFLNLQILCPM